ncbi:MAG: non-homologous end-joining DNA ligase [Dongiaceae bacterium]
MRRKDKLSLYRKKRDFSVTPEPPGERPTPSGGGRYVIQRHAARRLHYDLRLEIDGVYKSWAVTRGPSLDPKDRRLAVEVEDHPIEYGTFEGTIPKGEYGGGTVMLWDRGLWIPEGNPAKAHKKGHIAFELRGERLHGGYSLVRMADRGEAKGRRVQHNWLLIKKNDRWAKPGRGDDAIANATSVKSGRTMREIAEAKGGARQSNRPAAKRVAANVSDRGGKRVKLSALVGPETATQGDPPPAGSDKSTVAGVKITHPTRVIDPATGTTKLDVARYYERVAKTLLMDMKDRPVTVVRNPGGITGQSFFQRHPQRTLAGRISTVKDPVDKEDLLCVRNIRDIVTLVQFGAIEIHPWQTHIEQLDKADRFILDLDPAPDVPFGAVTLAAKLVRKRLDEVGLKSIVKTTGGKGLHVIVPLRPAADWKTVKSFAKAIADGLARADPKVFITKASKAARKGRIYVDYLRNDRGSTAVGAYCVRARPDLPVAMPLDWRDLTERLRPADFNLRTAAKAALPKDWRAARKWRQGLDARKLKAVGLAEKQDGA